jgi:uncharacterized protein (UPF0212 family)
MTVDWNLVITLVLNLGAIAAIGKWVVAGVAKSNENIPVMLQILKTHTDGIKELFDSRNQHALDIQEIRVGIDYCGACNEHRHRRSTDSLNQRKG